MTQRILSRLHAGSPFVTEESLPLRVAVQVLVAIGIIATDLAAGTLTSIWAVPLSFVGAYWSWRRRKARNVGMKFAIALGMLVALVAFFGRLLPNLGDTRLILAELLIHLQILHSFDLPRRRDLGYSTLIGLILLGVAATLSENLLFGPVLVMFIIAALPTLVLDYRSRLGLPPRTPQPAVTDTRAAAGQANNWQQLAMLAATVIVLGLAIFAALPRFPGYQIRSFPVSVPEGIQFPQFDRQNRGFVNPGYQREDAEQDGQAGASGGGSSPQKGAGTLDSTYYYGFGDRINQNLRGQLESQPVLRLRSQAKGWLRVTSFDRYTGQGWEMTRQEPLLELRSHPLSFKFRLTPQFAFTGRTREVIQTFTVLSELPNIIPAQATAVDLYFPAAQIGVDLEGNLRATSLLLPDLTYTAISQVPFRDRELLRQAPAEYPETITRYHLQVPPDIRDRVRAEAEALLAKTDRPFESTYEKVLYLTQAVKQSYRLRGNLPFLEDDQDLVETFLFEHGGGYSDHFSTVLTVMLRSLDIPARLATGFGPGEFSPFTGFYTIKNTDASALTEVYFPGFGWTAFDPIPGHPLIPPSIEDSHAFGVLEQAWSWVAGWLPSPVKGFFAGVWQFVAGNLIGLVARLWAWFTQSWLGAIAGLFCLTVLGFMGWVLGRWWQAWARGRRLARLEPMERLYQQMLATLAAKGYPKHPAQTPFEYVRTSETALEAPMAAIVAEICQAYVRWRYGDRPPNMDYLESQWLSLQQACRRLNPGA
ncbi:MAG: transglutaminaseTgpA domain-containing protein [Cyanobacteria bacterium J06641_5]